MPRGHSYGKAGSEADLLISRSHDGYLAVLVGPERRSTRQHKSSDAVGNVPGKSANPIGERPGDEHCIRNLLLLEVELDLAFGKQGTLLVLDLGSVVAEFAGYEQFDTRLARCHGVNQGALYLDRCCRQGRDEDFRILEFVDELGLIRVVDGHDSYAEIGQLFGCRRLDLRRECQSDPEGMSERSSDDGEQLTDPGRARTLTLTPGTLTKFLTIKLPILAEPGLPPPRPPATVNDLYVDML
jgi:hypothetical protein